MKPTKLIVCCLLVLLAAHLNAQNYTTQGSNILKDGCAWYGRGVNYINTGGDIPSGIYDNLQSDVVRIPIDMKRSIHTDTELQNYVDQARQNGAVVIFDAHWYDNRGLGGGTDLSQAEYTGDNPTQNMTRFNQMQTRMAEIANLFKNQMDVWFHPWNEPYKWNNTNGYNDALWESDARLMVENIRNTGANNIIVLNGNKQGQGIDPFLTRGANIINDYNNIVFSVHMYENGWEISTSAIVSKINQVKNVGPLIIGEMAAGNHFQQKDNWDEILEAARQTNTTLTYWIYGQEWSDRKTAIRNFVKEARTHNCDGGGINLGVSPSSLSFGSPAGNKTFSISSNTSWTVTDNQGWISVSPGSGSNNATVNVTVTANSSTSSRSGTVTVSGGGQNQTLSITQSGTSGGGSSVIINDTEIGTSSNKIRYFNAPGNVSEWSTSTCVGCGKYQDDDHYTIENGAYYEVYFNGTGIKVFSKTASHHGSATVKINGTNDGTINLSGATNHQVLVYEKTGLPNGPHTLRVTLDQAKAFVADKFEIITSSGGGTGSGCNTIEAEDYTGNSGGNNATGKGSTGSYFDFGGNGSWVAWNNVNVAIAGTYTIDFNYANGSTGDRRCELKVNGTTQGNINFSTVASGDWEQWGQTSPIQVVLNAGNNTIRLNANTSAGGPNIDFFEVCGTGSSGSRVGDKALGTGLDEQVAPIIYPNPTEGSFTITGVQDYTQLNIYDLRGMRLVTRELNGTSEVRLDKIKKAGVYVVLLQNSKVEKRIKLVIR